MCVFQELTEEGIPFLILFHVKEDGESLEKFQQEVARQLISEKGVCVHLLMSQAALYTEEVLMTLMSPPQGP